MVTMRVTRRPDPTRIAITWQDPAMMQIGKAGVSDAVVSEARRLLKEHEYIKVRVLRTALSSNRSKTDVFEELCMRTGATLAGVRGNTAVIYKIRK